METEELKALLAEVTQGDWGVGRMLFYTVFNANPKDDDDGGVICDCETEADARLIAMAPALARRVIAAEKLVGALRVTREKLASLAHYEFDGVWSKDDFANETKEADQALAEWEAAQ